MRNRSLYTLLSGFAALIAVALVLAVLVIAPNDPEGFKLTAVPQITPSPPAEGIAVHGHWTIEVRNPDGVLAERRDFENAISGNGSGALASILARQYSVGSWFILLNNTAGPTPWRAIGFGRGPGTIYEAGGRAPPIYQNFDTLTVDMPTSGVNQNKLVLSGTATAQDNGDINTVSTNFYRLNPSSPPSVTSTGAASIELTTTTLSSPVSLTGGQTVTVTVVISFS